jgi:uncharacterized protein (TIGR00288 family)
MINKRSVVIIDGSNLYFKLKSLGLEKGIKFNYKGWVKKLTEETTLVAVYYCVGKIRAKQNDVKARKMMAAQQSFVTQLIKFGFIIQYGYLLKSDSKFNEKGVDVQMAVDILKGAYKDLYDQAFLISSDSDLIPAIEEAQTSGKEVTYVGFKHQPSYALLKTCKRSILIDKNDIKEFKND